MSPKLRQATADDLPVEVMVQHRVIFDSGSKDGTTMTLLTDGPTSAADAAPLAAKLNRVVKLRSIDDKTVAEKTKAKLRERFFQVLSSAVVVQEKNGQGARDLPSEIIAKYRIVSLGRDEQNRMILLTDRLPHTPDMKVLTELCGGEFVLEFLQNKPEYAEVFGMIMEASGASAFDDMDESTPAPAVESVKPASRRVHHRGSKKPIRLEY